LKKIIRSRRRTIALEVTHDAILIVRAPLRTPVGCIEDLVRQKSSWIRRKFEEMKRRPLLPRHEYAEGELFFYLGRAYPLHFVNHENMTIERGERFYISHLLLSDIRNHMKRWYREEARREIQARCMWLSKKTGLVPATIRITDARQRWGSCTHKGGLNFSWRLIQAPPEIVDYVVVHELVHLGQQDHSKKFWSAVRKIMPDYDVRRKWLQENQQLLNI
jgi:predicted metal-dependent hydrolase